MQTIVELPEFQRRASSLLHDTEKQNCINYLASNPQAGVLIQDTGGLRKLRWASGNKGKRGGVRVIYYYHNTAMPLFLLSIFGKHEKADLSKTETNALAKFTRSLVQYYGN